MTNNSPTTHKKNCINCSKEFTTEFETKKYCTQACKQDHFYKRKFNYEFIPKQRDNTENSINDNKPLSSENISIQNKPGTEDSDRYLQKYIESINQIAELKTKLEIANFRLENFLELQGMDQDDYEETLEEDEKDKFYKTLNGILPLALSAFIKKQQPNT